uniref:Uncharacterized protein n=1 Tax=viral metagenome TaxID=1070528 RepID=A0A6C0JI58_9ZZZZ
MLRGLLLEYTGTLLIAASLVFTHASPVIVGLAYMSALFIADGHSDGLFTPLGILTQYLLGRVTPTHSLKLLCAQIAAGASAVLIYTTRKLTVPLA